MTTTPSLAHRAIFSLLLVNGLLQRMLPETSEGSGHLQRAQKHLSMSRTQHHLRTTQNRPDKEDRC
jgi:hypothetical protein